MMIDRNNLALDNKERTTNGFSPEQQNYLQGFALGADVARKVLGLPVLSQSGGSSQVVSLGPQPTQERGWAHPESAHRLAQDGQAMAGGKLCPEEEAKRLKDPFALWDEMEQRAKAGKFPQGTDVFLQKYHGLFFVAPAQNAYMCRLRFAGGAVRSYQLRGLADMAERLAGPYADITTRANLQLREIPAEAPVELLMGLRDLGIINTGAGADNIRNVTASPLSGLDPTELIETLPLARAMHHTILHHREMYGLPRKFNIAFDGGGQVSALDDTNDIGFHATRINADEATAECPAGVYFCLALGGITGHGDFARPTGYLVTADECVKVAAAIVRVFNAHGNRTDRKRARLKYLLDDWGHEKFLAMVAQELGAPWRRDPRSQQAAETDKAAPRRFAMSYVDRTAHLGFHPQRDEQRSYAGVVVPAGRLTTSQLRGLADIADRWGSGEIRLTVWQNVILPNLPTDRREEVKLALEQLGLTWEASAVRAGLVACTGNAGCKYASANTKAHSLQLADYLEQRLELDVPLNIHLTGCPHSCAQHAIGDIGLLATGVEQGDNIVEGYHVFVGGGYGRQQNVGRLLAAGVPFHQVLPLVHQLLETYLQRRSSAEQSFADFMNTVAPSLLLPEFLAPSVELAQHS